MKPISCNQEMGDTERLLCPGAPQGAAQYHPQGACLLPGEAHNKLIST